MPSLKYDAFKVYLDDIRKKDFKLLNPEEEIELGKRIKEKDKEAVKTLVESNLRLVIDIANNYRNSGIEILELVAIGNEALVKAAWNFDYTKNVKFSTYATSYIENIISSHMDSYRLSTYMNVYLHRKFRNFYRVYNSFDESEEDRLKKTIEILGITIEEGTEILLLSNGVLSLNNKVTEETEDEMLDLLQDDNSFEDDLVDKLFVHEILNSDYLSEREKTILKLKYGIDNNDQLIMEEIAKITNLTPTRVDRIEKSALRKIRVKVGTKEYLKK